MKAARFLFIGPAFSGKTSFLAAFWVYANGAEHAGLAVKSHPKNSSYLEELQKAWINFSKVPRTSSGVLNSVELSVIRKADQAAFNLTIPDLAGETFSEIWTQRHWSPEFQALLEGSGGALLFIHPEKIEDGETLQNVQDLQAELPQAEPALESEPILAEKPIPAPFDIERVPTQIQLIDSLQLMAESGKLNLPFRLGVIVSAWDTVLTTQVAAKPEAWLRLRMPALISYLANNPDIFEFKVFGVSAQGIDYAKITPKFESTHPHDRCKVSASDIHDPKDVTTPVQWLIR